MAYLDEQLVWELGLEGEHKSLRRLAGRVGDDVELDGLATGLVRAHPAEATAAPDTSYAAVSSQKEERVAFAELKARQSVMWGNGPYERVTNTIRDIHARVVERLNPQPGEKVLDAATGTGAVALLAAERGADVVGMDLAPVLLDTARELAAERGVSVEFEVGDAEEMRYDDASFDVVASTCGVHVRSGPRGGGERACSRHSTRRPNRACLLDARGRPRPDVPDDGTISADARSGRGESLRMG